MPEPRREYRAGAEQGSGWTTDGADHDPEFGDQGGRDRAVDLLGTDTESGREGRPSGPLPYACRHVVEPANGGSTSDTLRSVSRWPGWREAKRALSSGGERFLDAEEVRGSNPLAPTSKLTRQQRFTMIRQQRIIRRGNREPRGRASHGQASRNQWTAAVDI
jgi:hypothetical protein